MYKIQPIPAFQDNYIWMIIHRESKQALIVDPGAPEDVIKTLEEHNLSLAGILITHHHYDHTGGVKEICRHHNVPVYGPRHPDLTFCNHICKEGDQIHFPSMALSLNVLEVPGHTLSHIVFYNQDWLFSGDTLFSAGCGRLFEGTPALMLNSLNKLAALPDQTKVFCAHEYTQANLKFAAMIEPENKHIQSRIVQVNTKRAQKAPTLPSTMLIEKLTNPFLRCDQPQVVAAAESKTKQTLESTTAVFSAIRAWKDQF